MFPGLNDFLNDIHKNVKRLSAVNLDDYIAIFCVGGHGPVIDLTEDQTTGE